MAPTLPNTLEELTQQEIVELRGRLDKELAERKKQERASAIEQVRELMARFEIAPEDLIKYGNRRTRKTGRVAPKYRDQNGNTWTGRGIKPRWLAEALASGATLGDFAI